MGNIRKKLADNIRKARRSKDMTQGDLCDAAGISLRGYQDIESGKHAPRQETLDAILEVLGLTEMDLMADEPKPVMGESKANLIASIVASLGDLDEPQLRAIHSLIEACRPLGSFTRKAK